MKENDYRLGEKISVACISGNVILSLLKFAAGIFGGSKAMIADAIHTVSDVFTTIIVIIGIRIAKKPCDKEHPYGHGKAEPIFAALLGIILFIAAIVTIKESIEPIRNQSFATPTFLALSAAVVSIIVKEAMYRVTYSAGLKINSLSIIADAWHHRSDALSSIGTFVGILGSMIGDWLNIHYLKYLDPIAGVLVACLIFKVAYDIIKDAIKNLMDTSPDNEKIIKIRETVSAIDGVISVSQIKGRYVGRHLFIDMEIVVDSGITIEAGHYIAVQAKNKIMDAISDVFDVLVHVEPGIGKPAGNSQTKGDNQPPTHLGAV